MGQFPKCGSSSRWELSWAAHFLESLPPVGFIILNCKSNSTSHTANTHCNVSMQTFLLNLFTKCVVWAKSSHNIWTCNHMNRNCFGFFFVCSKFAIIMKLEEVFFRVFLCAKIKNAWWMRERERERGYLLNLNRTWMMSMGRSCFYKELWSNLLGRWKT